MSRRSLFTAACLICLSLGLAPSSLQAVPLRQFSDDSSRAEIMTWAQDLKIVSSGKPFPRYSIQAPTIGVAQRARSSDPCGFSQGWLAQQKNGVVICGTLADFYAPKVTDYPVTRAANIAGAHGMALLLLGFAVLGLATRRPVWIKHLMR